MLDVLIDALIDSVKVLVVVFIFYIILSFLEDRLSKALEHNKKLSPLLGAMFGLIPQCGFSVVASDLYIKEHITMGTLIAIFISCSDEALPIILSSHDKAWHIIPLILIKFIYGFIVGFLVDVIYRKSKLNKEKHLKDCHHEDEIHIGCCGHEIDNRAENKWHKHLVHPLIHSLKIFCYVLVVNLLFGLIIYYIGEDSFAAFLRSNRFLTPLYAAIIGLIPNCASSVVVTELYLMNQISFGATLAGLITNAGLGLVVLLKHKEMLKKTFVIIAILFLAAILMGYGVCFIIGF